MQEEDEHGCGQEHGRRGALRGRMEGGKGGRWAWRVCYDAMNRMGWRKGGYVDDVVCFLESSERALRETQSHLQAARRSRARYIRPICVYICRILSGDRTV